MAEKNVDVQETKGTHDVLARAYADMQAGNAAGFGALGVDMSSGSAADVELNKYQKEVAEWESRQNVNGRRVRRRRRKPVR